MAIFISETLLRDVISYIEDRESTIDNEWGSCRSAKEIIADGDMPAIYKRLQNPLKKRGVSKTVKHPKRRKN